MRGRIVRVALWAVLLGLFCTGASAQERWVYRYNGSADSTDMASSIVVGLDGNLYAAGYSHESLTDRDFTVVSLNASGVERWVYRYNGPGNDWDHAYSIVEGGDGNFYAAGYSCGIGTSDDFTVVSLTNSGTERWVYRYNGPGNKGDWAWSIVAGLDGNLYVAGGSYGIEIDYDLVVVSLTESGAERWVYRYNGPGNGHDGAQSIAVDSDGNLYAAGYSDGGASLSDFTVVSLTDSGVERWVYRYNGPADTSDAAKSIVVGTDGNLYAAGQSNGDGTSHDFTVVSLTDSGTERWVYRYNGPGSWWDEAYCIVMGPDGNLYAAGESYGDGTSDDFIVVSLTALGSDRWIYRYNGPGNGSDDASSIVMASDGNLYAAGTIRGTGTLTDLSAISLTESGSERWVYRYNGPGNQGDWATAIATGSDGNLYVAGGSYASTTDHDLTVVSLGPDIGVAEELGRPSASVCHLLHNYPNPFGNSTLISYSLPAISEVTLTVYDITGRLVDMLVNETQEPGIHQVRWNRRSNPSGVYFYRLKACPERSGESIEPQSQRAGEFVETRKMAVVE
jgi:uncharacterized delta-60 repeat protein